MSLKRFRGGLSVAALAAAGIPTAGAAQGAGHEPDDVIIVTTQKRAESIQDVPIAVTAFDADGLNQRNIANGQDLQFSIPNFQASQGNFSSGSISIRGIVNAAVAASSDDAVGAHINGVPSEGSFILETEFYDTERVEILRGPQGTLYGRNATAGVLNVVTAKPQMGEFGGNLELTVGNFDHVKATGHVNIPLGENFAARVAGYYMKRDGFSEALLFDGSTADADGRDLYSVRATIAGEPTDRMAFWAMYERYEENSSRSRSTKQLCNKDTRPFPFNQGCVAYQLDPNGGLGYARDSNGDPVTASLGYGTVNTVATLGGVLAGNLGLLNGFGTDVNLGQTTSSDLRAYETNILPEFSAYSDTVHGEFTYDVTDGLTFVFLGSYVNGFREFTDDYNKGVGSVQFNVTALTPDLDGDGDGDFPGGAAFGLDIPYDTRLREPADVLLATDLSSADYDGTTFEARLQSSFNGPVNFTLGGIKIDYERETDYLVFFNTAEALAVALSLPGDRTYFRSHSPYELDALGVFGEAYWQPADSLKFTLGLRYTKDKKTQPVLPSLLLSGAAPGELNGEFVNVAAAPPDGVQRASFEEVTGRAGLDWQAGDILGSDDTLVYLFASRGYKGGGINPPASAGLQGVEEAFDPEFINAIELGTKSSFFDGAATLNMAAFYYDYKGYQISTIVNRQAVNQNVDADVLGFEAELYLRPTDRFEIDAGVGLLKAELKDQLQIDPFDQTGGDPDWVVVKDPVTTQNCIADFATASALNAAVGGTPLEAAMALICDPAALNATLASVLGQATADALTPQVREANPVDISGNKLPRAPEVTFSIGAQYTADLSQNWRATLRGDFYLQSHMFSRTFNLEADRIDGFNYANAALTFWNEDLGLEVEVYAKNIFADDSIVNHYLTDASSGLFANVFALDPRQFGVRISKGW